MILALIACFLSCQALKKGIVRIFFCLAGFTLFHRNIKTHVTIFAFLGILSGKGHLHAEKAEDYEVHNG